ncbi:MAG TPA: phage terminase large subunit, partial [Chloroflexota bacterium]
MNGPTIITYAPRGAARALFTDRSPELLVSGPAGTGKSRACLEKLHLCACKYPGMRGLILRKTHASLTSSGLVTYKTKVLHPLDHVTFFGGSAQDPPEFRYPNGSRILVGGLDKPSKIMSTEYDLIFVQEAVELEENDWESATTRLRNGVMPYQQLLADCNPDAPGHWLKRRADRGVTTLLESRHEENPTVTPAYLAKLDALTGVRYLRLRLGKWAAAEGMVYEAWDRSRHILSPEALLEQGITIPGGMPHPTRTRGVYAGVDWGFSNPGVILVGAVDGDGRLTILHETYRTGRLISWWTDLAVQLAARYRIETFACDPSEPAYLAQFRAAGLDAVAGDNAIAPGIQRV